MNNFFILFGGDFLDYYPKSEEDISFIKFLAKYQYADVNDLQYLFSSKKYYKTKITKLSQNNIVSRLDHHIILSKNGKDFAKSMGVNCSKPNRNSKYLPRLYYLSSLAAFFYKSKFIKFIPSFDIKDNALTTSSRRYVGILIINGIEYLTYHISIEHDNKYISSIIYDIQKEHTYKNIIVLYDKNINLNQLDFVFGLNQVLLVEDTIENKTKLQYIHCIDWYKIIEKEFKEPFISAYNFCDYEDMKGKYISFFTFFDTEKINRINNFLSQNRFKKVDILCSKNIADRLKQTILRANYICLDLEKYIDREKFCYE